MTTIRETLHHGDFYHVADVTIPELTEAAFAEILKASPYTYSGELDDAGHLTNRSAKRAYDDLVATGRGGHSWSWFDVVPEPAKYELFVLYRDGARHREDFVTDDLMRELRERLEDHEKHQNVSHWSITPVDS